MAGEEIVDETTQPPAVEEKPRPRGRQAAAQEEFVPALRRIVLYTTGDLTIRPAIITRVASNGTVDLSVFNSQGCVPVTAVSPGDADTPGTYFTE